MTLPLDAVRAAVTREWARFVDLASSASEEDWASPTRLDGWTVRDVVTHAVWGVSMEADGLRRRRQGEGGRADGRAPRPAAGRDELLADLDGAREQLLSEVAALREADLESPVPLPYGDVPVALFSQILVMEAGVHTSDLAAALGDESSLAEDVSRATEVFLQVFLALGAGSAAEAPEAGTSIELRGPEVALGFRYDDGRWEASRPPGPPSPGATLESDDSTILLFALGRVRPTDPRLSVSGDPGLIDHFKTWLPGP